MLAARTGTHTHKHTHTHTHTHTQYISQTQGAVEFLLMAGQMEQAFDVASVRKVQEETKEKILHL